MQIIARSDDFGASRQANQAVFEALGKGYVTRNVSCLAVGPYMDEGASELAKYKNCDIGLHCCITSEWNGVRWGALTQSAGSSCGFVQKDGTFYKSCQEIAANKPDVSLIIEEYKAQLDKLTKLGLDVKYIDSHMFPEAFIEGLTEAFDEWILKTGLINARYHYNYFRPLTPAFAENYEEYRSNVGEWLNMLPKDKIMFYLTHPTVDSEESLLMYNEHIAKGVIRHERSLEHQIITDSVWNKWKEELELQVLSYTEAEALRIPSEEKAENNILDYL